jgi:hypothetical protein
MANHLYILVVGQARPFTIFETAVELTRMRLARFHFEPVNVAGASGPA